MYARCLCVSVCPCACLCVHVRVCVCVCVSKAVLANIYLRVNQKAFVGTSEHTRLRAGGKEGEVKGGGGERGHSISCSMNLFKSISICVHIFITSAIIKSQHHR